MRIQNRARIDRWFSPVTWFAAVATVCLASLMLATSARADIEIQWTGHLTNAFGDYASELVGDELVSGTLILDETIVGTFTPSPNPQFLRSEMLYSGAVISMNVVIDGVANVSGVGGDVLLLDAAAGSLAGDDSYESTSVLSGAIGTVAAEEMFWNAAYPTTGFTVGSTDPLVGPPALDLGSVNQFAIRKAPGDFLNTISGRIDTFTVTGGGGPAVPVAGALGSLALAVGLAVTGLRGLRRER